MMRMLHFLLLFVLLTGCQKNSFADNISLAYPKNTEMKIQEFNEDGNEGGENLLYIGKIKPNVEVKFYENLLEPPPPAPDKFESKEEYSLRIKKIEDSLQKQVNPFFKTAKFPFLLENNDSFIDSLSYKNLEIIVKENDTIPLYKRNYDTKEIKIYKAFPVFIKNISDKVLKIPTNSKSVAFYFKNNENKYQFLRNSNYMICGMSIPFHSYFELKTNEVLIYAYPYFKKGKKRKAKVKFYNASSKGFEISVDEKILEKQRNKFIE